MINECKNFKNNLIIARNNSLSLNDVLKTLGDKMNGNINQLNNKIEILIQNDQKFKNYMKFQENSLKKIKKLISFQDYILNYLIEINNETEISYYKGNKEMQTNFVNKYKNSGQGVPRRLKSSFNGPFFNFKKKPVTKKISIDNERNGKPSEKPKIVFDRDNFTKTIEVKKLRSSIVGNNSIFNNNLLDFSRSKTNPIKRINISKTIKRVKSLDGKILNITKKMIEINKLESDILSKINHKKPLSLTKNDKILEVFMNKFEK
jgi:hypothetical protein